MGSEQDFEKVNDGTKLVEVMCSTVNTDVYLAMHKLQENGIEACIDHETLSNTWGAAPGLSRGLSLMVREECQYRAIEVLRASGFLPCEEDPDQKDYHGPLGMIPGKTLAAKLGFLAVVIVVLTAGLVYFATFYQK